jgi:hypothetical protein
MSIIIKTEDNEQIILNDLNPYLDIKLITSLIDSEETEENNNSFELKKDYEIVLDVKLSTLKKILEYSLHCYEIKSLNITEQDKYNYINKFLDCKHIEQCELLNTADYLEYEVLVDIICEKIADDIQKCDSVESVKKKFNIKNIISEAQEKELLNEIK